MTRSAAEVQAEIDAYEAEENTWYEAAEADLDATGYGPAWDAQHWLMRKRLKESGARGERLRDEHARLARAELDDATPPDIRTQALRLRAAYRSADGWAMGAEDPWEALETAEASAWAAVAREAGR